jgi:hypothetical protein
VVTPSCPAGPAPFHPGPGSRYFNKFPESAVFLTAEAVQAQTMVITGVIRNLDGTQARNLENFTVEATQGNLTIGTGRLTSTPTDPAAYTITINTTLVNPADVRVLLSFRATGRDAVDLDKVVGKSAVLNDSQTLDVVLPESKGVAVEQKRCCLFGFLKCWK